jgi:hypothetical protein
MIPRLILPGLAGLFAFGLAAISGHAEDLSPQKLDMLDQMGYFTPGFKAAVRDLVESKQALAQASAEKTKLNLELPAQAQSVALRRELAKYDHPEENDFVALQWKMKDPNVKPEDLIALAQAYVWTYPTSPHEGEAMQYLQQLRLQMSAQRQAIAEDAATREAAHAQLVQRAQAHDLSLEEWRDFLRDMSEDDLVKLIGRPSTQRGGYWIYTTGYVVVPGSTQKPGLMLNFNAGRVISVDVNQP